MAKGKKSAAMEISRREKDGGVTSHGILHGEKPGTAVGGSGEKVGGLSIFGFLQVKTVKF